MKLDLKKDHKLGKNTKRILIIVTSIIVVLYSWEYYCTTRPVNQCSSLCETRSKVFATFGSKTIYNYSCVPWYRWFWRGDF